MGKKKEIFKTKINKGENVKDFTTIKISRSLWKKLNNMKESSSDTFNDIIERILKDSKTNRRKD